MRAPSRAGRSPYTRLRPHGFQQNQPELRARMDLRRSLSNLRDSMFYDSMLQARFCNETDHF